MSKPAIKAIVWDLGNVLVKFDHRKACRRFAEHTEKSAEEIYNIIIHHKILGSEHSPIELHDAGRITSEEFFTIIKDLALFRDSLSFDLFSEIWMDIFEENTDADALLSSISTDVVQCILSNIDAIHWKKIAQMNIIKKHFPNESRIVRSYTAKSRKPEKKIYTDVIRACRLTDEEMKNILYIDDVAEYRDTFASLGGNVGAYNCSEDGIEVLNAILQEYELL